jgi:hypothetical protein
MKITHALLILVSAASFSACEDKKEDGSYSYEINGCKTGAQSYSSKDELCSKLKNDSLNNGCARSARRERFNQECGGQNFDAAPARTAPAAEPSTPVVVNGSSFSGSYSYEHNGCATGQHDYNSRSELCSMLQNEDLNHGCASDERKNEYKKQCTDGGSASNGQPSSPEGEPSLPSEPAQPGNGAGNVPGDLSGGGEMPSAECLALLQSFTSAESACAALKSGAMLKVCPKEVIDGMAIEGCN